MSRRPVQCNLQKCTFSDTPHRYHPGHRVPVRLELADDPDDLAVPVFNEQNKRRKLDGASTGSQRASAPPLRPSAPSRLTPFVTAQTATQADIQVNDDASDGAGSAGAASEQARSGGPSSMAAQSAAEQGSTDPGRASRSAAGARPSPGSPASHEAGDFDDDLLDPSLRAGGTASGGNAQEDARGGGGSMSPENPASNGAGAGLAPSSARPTTQERATDSRDGGAASDGEDEESGQNRGAEVAPRTLKQQKRTFRSWQASLGRKFQQQVDDKYSFGFLATAHAKTYGNGSEVRIPYRVVTGTTAIKYDHKMVSTSALTKDRYSAALLKTDLPPRVSRYHLFRHMDAVFSAIVAEEQSANAGADGRRLIESDARLAAAERAQERLKRDKRTLVRKLERTDRASKRAVHAQYARGRTVMIRNGYSADQVREELGSEPENPGSSDEDSEESEEESDLSDS